MEATNSKGGINLISIEKIVNEIFDHQKYIFGIVFLRRMNFIIYLD